MIGDDIRSPFDEGANERPNPNVGFKVGPFELGQRMSIEKKTHPWEDAKPQYRMQGWGN